MIQEALVSSSLEEIDRCQFSYAALAKLMNLSQGKLSTKMQGKKNFMETEWAKLAEIFGKPAKYLLQRDDGLKTATS